MEINFKGKRALVTGASQGIGREIALRLAKGGAKVLAIGRNVELMETLHKEHESIEILVLDITDRSATENALKSLNPPVDLLVNNAGVALLKPITEYTSDDYDFVFNTNVKALIHITQLISAQILKNVNIKMASIVNISSQASIVGLANHAIYCASKGAVDAYTRAAALDLGAASGGRIRVNSVNPTVIMTDMGRLGWSDPKVAQPMLEKIPLKRFGEVTEVVDTVLFLLSDKASLITGTCLPIDGGYTST